MMHYKTLLAATAVSVLLAADFHAAAQPLKYPSARKENVVDNYHGTEVADPYRWLEYDTAADVKEWVAQQNEVTQSYLGKIPYRDKIKNRLTELWNYPRQGAPTEAGGKYYFFKNDGLQNQSVLYVADAADGKKAKVFLDPNKLSTDGTVALGNISFSKDGSFMGYTVNRSGSDWQEIYVMDTKTKMRTKDSIRWAKFSGISWQGSGFYYSRYDEPASGGELSSKNGNQKVFFHKLGTPQSADELVFEDPSRPLIGFGAGTTEDETMLVMYATEGASSGNELYVKNLKSDKEFKKLFNGFANNYIAIDNIGDKLLIMTDFGAPRYRLVLVDPGNPDPKNWKVIIPENKNVLSSAGITGGKIFTTYMQDAAMHVYQYSMDGKLEHEIELPGLGTVGGFGGKRDAKEVYYVFTSFTYPASVFKYDIPTGKSSLLIRPEVKFNPDDYESKQVFVTSADGTNVPMFIVHKKGLQLNGQNPTYLYGYGGFNISLNPNFTANRLVLLENGGIFAMVNLRGGGEYGEDWHKAGMLGKKQNVFNDFIAAAEYLVANSYTSPDKLAIAGGSNGGLLVGATLNQRPDLFRVAFPAVGVMDMLRFHKFTIGYAWVNEYGSSDDQDQFQFLYKYSPVHNIKNTNYPSVMVTTADHDDRVVPAHSFKYAATLQEKNTSDNPTLIRIEVKAGHGAGKPTSKLIEEWADIWSFMFHEMGVTPVYK